MLRPTLPFLLALSSLASAQELVPDQAIEIELKATDPLLEGHGPSRTFEYDVTFEGTLYVWATSKNFDPILRITDSDGELLAEDDDSGGGTTACVVLEVSRNELPSIVVASKTPNFSGKLLLHVSEAPETSATRNAVAQARETLVQVGRLHSAGSLEEARGSLQDALHKLLEVEGARTSAGVAQVCADIASEAQASGAFRLAHDARAVVREHPERTLPGDHPELQTAREQLALASSALGEEEEPKLLFVLILEAQSRTLPEDHPLLQRSRMNLAAALANLGDLSGAQRLFEQALEVQQRTLPAEDLDLQWTRSNVALLRHRLGDLSGARALQEQVLEARERALLDDDPRVQEARANLAMTLRDLGDLPSSRALAEKVLQVRSRTLPGDHPDLQLARMNVGVTLIELGDLAGARALLEKALESLSRTLPDEHSDLQAARQCLAQVLFRQGDLPAARPLQEIVLDVFARTYPEDSAQVQDARLNLASTLRAMGKLAQARELQEHVLEIQSRALPSDHLTLQWTRSNLALTEKALGDFVRARVLDELVLDARARQLPDEHPAVQEARMALVATIARQAARAYAAAGRDAADAQVLEEAGGRCLQVMSDLCRARVRASREAILTSSGRETEERCSNLTRDLDACLSFACGLESLGAMRPLEAEAFAFSETTRGAALAAADLSRAAASSASYSNARAALRDASVELAALARSGTESEAFDRARTKRESLERELMALARAAGEPGAAQIDVASIAERLADGGAAVAFRRFQHTFVRVVDGLDLSGQQAVVTSGIDSLCAFVVRKTDAGSSSDPMLAASLALVDLGPIEHIRAAVESWRESLGAGTDERGVSAGSARAPTSEPAATGRFLREAIFDPLLPELRGARRVVVVLDDVVHLVPVEALPLEGNVLVGDRWSLETRTTLTELLRTPRQSEDAGRLVAFGSIDYDASPSADADAPPSATAAPVSGSRSVEHAGILRGTAWSMGFSPLPATGPEVRGIARCFRERFGQELPCDLGEASEATRERLLSLAPKARWLHIATHGWFATESIQSWSDPEPLDKQSGLGMRMSGAEQVKGMSPMLLCGLALAGANLSENELGRVPGLVTADELSTLDLSNCELVVLSACDTNVGERRAGQGVASLQKALQMAGARSVITSLWKVPDEATKELMLDFYRRMWVEKKPKWQALWEAKMKLRNAKDEQGRPLYSTRDWAAWVLTGEPN